MTTPHPIRPSGIPLGLTLAVGASGASALGLQMVWARMFALGLGQELPSTLGVITAFLADWHWVRVGVVLPSIACRLPGFAVPCSRR